MAPETPTEPKRAEETLRQSEARFRALFESSRDAIGVSLSGTHIFVNPAYAAMYGYDTPTDLISIPIMACIAPVSRETIRQRIQRRAQGLPEPDVYEVRGLRRDGTEFDLENRVTHYQWQGETYTLVIQRDITDQREAEAKLAAAYRREVMINQIGQAIRQTRDPDTIQSTAAHALGQALGADRAYFSLLDPARDAFLVSHDFHRADLPPLTGAYPISVFQQDPIALYPDGKTRVFSDIQTWDMSAPLAEALRAMHIRASISVPLFDKNTLIGALAVAMTDGPRAWTADEIALVESVAAQTRAALDAAGLQARERRIAEQLQRALQPAPPDHIPGLSLGKYTRPALDEAAVGGDFFDVFPLNSERCALVIGDVSGKGLAAAQQLALVRNSLRTTLYLYRSPALAATSLNTIVTTHDLLVGFVTVFVGIYDIATGQITYASCGHEPGLLRRAAGGPIEPLPPTGPPLGIYEHAAYEEATVTLSPGDTLLLYTDGLSEAGPNRLELLGADGLTRLFSALPPHLNVQAQAEALVSEVQAGADGTFRDDIAVLLCRRASEEQPYQPQTEG